MSRERLDIIICRRGILDSRERARAAVMCGEIFVDGHRIVKPGTPVDENCAIEHRGQKLAYCSRGGLKLEKALDSFGVSPEGRICLDCGASTGGFTDCLLQRGAAHVYAADVGYGQLAWRLRADTRVTVMDRTNVRHMTPDMLPRPVSLVTADVSFISLALILPAIRPLYGDDGGETICLIKPQFEAGRGKVGKKGVVRDADTHAQVLRSFADSAREAGFATRALTYSPVKGPNGNIEYLGLLAPGGAEDTPTAWDVEETVRTAHEALNAGGART
jgi:23S rRNA (cytidine1920-2'-O)/16S rRNA (cytidine1409-2'-O)-methyltransferase